MTRYPVATTIALQTGTRNRLTVAARPILAIPHAMLVGPIYFWSKSGSVGLLGAAAYLLAVVSWFTLLIHGTQPAGIRAFTLYYLRWRVRALAYMALFVDAYPPFGDGVHPAGVEVTAPAARDRGSIAIRLLLAVPHLVALFLLTFAWLFATIGAWAVILVRGTYPAPVAPFAIGVLTWLIRVEAYLLLLVDEYPPFRLGD